MSKNFKKITPDITKGQTREVVCGRCDRETNHVICSSVALNWGNEEFQIYGSDTFEIIRCLGCDQISFRIGSNNSEDCQYDSEGNSFYVEREEIYPSRLMGRTALDDAYLLPTNVEVIYRETHVALCTKLKILTGVGIRTLIEAVCTEESAKGTNLETKINDLVAKGILTANNATILHKTRLLGNIAAHVIRAPTDSELDVAFDIVENLLNTVYLIPKKAQALDKLNKTLKR